MTQGNTTTIAPVEVSVARQAIFDGQRRLWGYEIFCVGNAGDTPSGLPADRDVPVSVAASAGLGLQQVVAHRKRVLVSLTEKNILDDQAYALPAAGTSILVDEQVFGRPGVAASLKRLKADGFTVAVPAFTGVSDCAELYGMADVMGVAVGQRSRDELAAAAAAVHAYGATPMACAVADSERFVLCQELGFELFQGAFSKVPEIVAMRKIASNQVVRLNLLKALEADEPDLKALAKQIQADATLSFRLLTHLNSASYGLSHKVGSITHAISLLGWRQVRNWLRVVLLSDVSDGATNPELLPAAAQRAKFLELIAERYSFWGFVPESMHLLGLFSLLDAMIGVPMKEIVTYLPLASALKGALCGEPGNEYLPLLNLARQLEEARWGEAEEAIGLLNLDSAGTKAAFQEAVEWAGELMTLIEG